MRVTTASRIGSSVCRLESFFLCNRMCASSSSASETWTRTRRPYVLAERAAHQHQSRPCPDQRQRTGDDEGGVETDRYGKDIAGHDRRLPTPAGARARETFGAAARGRWIRRLAVRLRRPADRLVIPCRSAATLLEFSSSRSSAYPRSSREWWKRGFSQDELRIGRS